MSSFLNQIAKSLLPKMTESIVETLTDAQFSNLTILTDGITNFGDARRNTGYKNDIPPYLFELYKNGTLGILLQKLIFDNDDSGTSPLILALKKDFEKFVSIDEEGKIGINPNISTPFLLNDDVPFIDRADFRRIVNDSLLDENSKIIFVTGKTKLSEADKSKLGEAEKKKVTEEESLKDGITYLKEYLQHLRQQTNLFKLKTIDVQRCLEGKAEGHITFLAQEIAGKLGIIDERNFEDMTGNRAKNNPFITKIREKIKNENITHILYLDGFHHITNLVEDINIFITEFIDMIEEDFPKIVLIIAGFPIEKLKGLHILRLKFPFYQIENLELHNIEACLKCIYDKFSTKIKSKMGEISEPDYIEIMLQRMLVKPTEKIDIASIGFQIADHIHVLKTM